MRETTKIEAHALMCVALAMSAVIAPIAAQSGDSANAGGSATSFRISEQARGPLHELWENSLAAKQERVACLGGRIDHGVVYITNVELLAPSRADSTDISAVGSLRECSAPAWLGTVHTHIATFQGRPYAIFSAPDRYVMMLWREKWKAPGVFCILYTAVDANCEMGYAISGHVHYAYARRDTIAPNVRLRHR